MFAVSPLVVYFCQRVFSLANNTMIILGVVGLFSSCLIISFAVSPLLVFIGELIDKLSSFHDFQHTVKLRVH